MGYDFFMMAFAVLFGAIAAGFPSVDGGLSRSTMCPLFACALIFFFSCADILLSLAMRSNRAKRDSQCRYTKKSAGNLSDGTGDTGNVSPDETGSDSDSETSPCRFLPLLGATVFYAILMPQLGFVVSTGLYCAVVLRIFNYKNLLRACGFGFAFAFVLYVVFGLLMKVALPSSILN